MRPIDADTMFDFLTEQIDKETGAYSKGRNVGINIARSALHDKAITPTIALPPNDPLTLEQLREMDGEPVEVVRCKDCKHLYFKDFSAFCQHRISACSPDGFCEYGERRKPEERT